MFIRKRELVRRIEQLERTVDFLLSEDRALFSRLEALESDKTEADTEAQKAEELYMQGLSNVMNYNLENIRKENEKYAK